MRKKKSYMDTDNIISEGLFNILFKTLIPKSVQQNITTQYVDALEKEINASEKKIDDLNKQAKEAQEKIFKALEKRSGKKIKRQSAEKAIKNYFNKNK